MEKELNDYYTISEELIRELQHIYKDKIIEEKSLCNRIDQLEDEISRMHSFSNFFNSSSERFDKVTIEKIENYKYGIQHMQAEIEQYESYLEARIIQTLPYPSKSSRKILISENSKKKYKSN